MGDMKCPFCQQELKEIYCNGICVGLRCKNVGCFETKSTLGNKALWQELIRTRKALAVAVDALKEYADEDNWSMGFAPWAEDASKDALYTEDGYKAANVALEQITALEQKDK